LLVSDGAFSPTTYGDAQPSWGGNQYYYAGQGLNLTNAFQSYGQVYKTQPWIATLVNKIAYGTARLPLKVYGRDAQDARTEQRDTPLARLLRNPNPRDDKFFFWLWTVSTHEIYGEAMWVKVRPSPGAAPTQLWPLHPANVMTRRNESGDLIYRYLYGAKDGEFLEWGTKDIVHFKSYNPENQVRGLSRLEPLRQTILNEDAARRAAAAMWSNGGRPSFVVSAPKGLSDTAFKRVQAGLQGLHQGVDNWGKIAILEEGLTPHTFDVNANSMQFVEARKINAEESCGIYDVPPPVVHILDRATFSNITEQMRSMYRDTMAPRLGLYESVLDAQLRPDFDPRGSLYAEFLLDEVMRGAFEQRAVANQAAIFSGQRTPNEVRKDDNKPPLEGGDVLYINAGAIPLNEADNAARARNDASIARITQSRADLPVIDVNQLCFECGTETPELSARDLCRSCEGRMSRMLERGEAGA
jgi:HK97 family phage portal protein